MIDKLGNQFKIGDFVKAKHGIGLYQIKIDHSGATAVAIPSNISVVLNLTTVYKITPEEAFFEILKR